MTKNFQKLLLTSTALTLSFNLAICTPVHAENDGDGDQVIENSTETILVDEDGKRIITKGQNSGENGVKVNAVEARIENQGSLTGYGREADSTGTVVTSTGSGILLENARGTEIINKETGTIAGMAFGIKGTASINDDGVLFDASSNTFIVNYGTIIGETNDAVHLMGGGDVSNHGTIEGHKQSDGTDTSAGDGISIMSFDGTREYDREIGVGNVENGAYGTISGVRFGVFLNGGGSVFNLGTIEGVKGGIVIRGGELDNQHGMNAHVHNDDNGIIRQNWSGSYDPANAEEDGYGGAAITMAGSADNPLGHVSLKNEGLIEGFAGVRIQADAMHIWNFGQIVANGSHEGGGPAALQIAANGTRDVQKIWMKNGENGEILGNDAQGIVTYGIMQTDGSLEDDQEEEANFEQGLTIFGLDNRGLIKGTNAVNVAGMAFIENSGIIKGTDGAGLIIRPGASLFPGHEDHDHGDDEPDHEEEEAEEEEETSETDEAPESDEAPEDDATPEDDEAPEEEENKDGWDDDSEANGEEDEDEVTKPEENLGLEDIRLNEEKHSDRHRLMHHRRASQILNKENGLIQGTTVGIAVGDNAFIANKGDIIGGDAGIAFINTIRDVDEVVVGIANKGTIHGDVVGIYARAGSRDEFRHGEELDIPVTEDGPVADAYLFIANAGTIAGNTAIQIDSTPETGLIHLRLANEGEILGDITLGAGNDRILNAGTINGDINLGSGDDIFKMIGNGTASGTVDGGEGIDLFILAHFEGDFDWDTFAINFEQIETNGDVVFNSGVDVRQHHAMIVNSNVTGDFRIAKFGKLKGAGTIFGQVNNQGVAAPGNSIGTLTVQGDYTQTADGAYELEVGGNASDVLNISGSASLAGNLDVVMDYSSTVLPGSSYTFLTAQSITGSLAVNANDPFFNASVQTTSGAMQIRLDRSSYLAPLVNTQRNALADFVNASAMTTSSVGVSGSMIAPVTTAHSAMVGGVGDAADATQENAPSDKSGWTYSFWSYGQSSEMSNAASGAFSTRGVMTVSALQVSDTLQYGFAAGGAQSYLSNNGVGASMGIGRHKSVDMAAFASYAKGVAFVVGTVTVNSDQFDEERYLANFGGAIAQAQSRSKAFSTGVSLEGRLKLNWGGVGILPIGRIHLMNMAMGEMTEHGAGISNMVLPSHTVKSLKTSFGLRMNKEFNTTGGIKIIPTLEAFYDREHGDTSKLMLAHYVSDPGVTLPVLSVLQSKNVGRLQAGILTKITQNLGLNFKYQARFADFDSQQMLSAGLKFIW